ncbi:MAG: hypothetical protein EBY39_07560 [Flavobacteriia bacterium]|nr:hypothetical protein [Flavobacteriia bacterium]
MKITLERTPEQVELIKAMASKNRDVAYEAQTALAEFIGPVLAEVVNAAPTVSNMFTSLQFNSDESPSIPLDLYHDITDEDYIQVWSQSVAGGLPTNQVAPSQSELKFTTYTLDSALSFDKRYASRSRLDVVSKTFTRMAQEILLKQEKTSATMIMTALAKAETNGEKHVIRSAQANRFLLSDLNKLFTKAKRINTAWTGGTPADRRGRGITDLLVSPEIVEEIRGLAYNPINTKGADGSAPSGDTNGIAGTDSMRDAIFNSAGIPEFYGVSIQEYNEMGDKQKWNTTFDVAADSTSYDDHYAVTASKSTFDGDTEQILVGVDLSRESMIRAVATDSESGDEFSLVADDQFVTRQSKIGYYGSLEEGRMIIDDRVLLGLIV